MKLFIQLITVIIFLALLAGCDFSPNALLGGEKDSTYYNSTSVNPSQTQTGITGCPKNLTVHSSSDGESCGLTSIEKVIPSIMRLSEGKVRISVKKGTDGKFPSLTTVEFRKKVFGTPETRDLKCAAVPSSGGTTADTELHDCVLEKRPNDDKTHFQIYGLVLTLEDCSVSYQAKSSCHLSEWDEDTEVQLDYKTVPELLPIDVTP